MGSESKKELFNQFTMYYFPEVMLVFAFTSFPFDFDVRLLGLIVTLISNQFLPKDTRMELVIKAISSNCLQNMYNDECNE